jgi:hypothetical protein
VNQQVISIGHGVGAIELGGQPTAAHGGAEVVAGGMSCVATVLAHVGMLERETTLAGSNGSGFIPTPPAGRPSRAPP